MTQHLFHQGDSGQLYTQLQALPCSGTVDYNFMMRFQHQNHQSWFEPIHRWNCMICQGADCHLMRVLQLSGETFVFHHRSNSHYIWSPIKAPIPIWSSVGRLFNIEVIMFPIRRDCNNAVLSLGLIAARRSNNVSLTQSEIACLSICLLYDVKLHWLDFVSFTISFAIVCRQSVTSSTPSSTSFK